VAEGAAAAVSAVSAGPQNAALQIVTPNQMRAQITAIFTLTFKAALAMPNLVPETLRAFGA
jgi:hypothetical protein